LPCWCQIMTWCLHPFGPLLMHECFTGFIEMSNGCSCNRYLEAQLVVQFLNWPFCCLHYVLT
jgi:hypothetical protein